MTMAVQKKGLGRGLDALLGDFTETPKEGVIELDVYEIDTNRAQPRKAFDEEKLRELSQSIKRHGMVQPIIVRKSGERYTIVAGERRYRAARMANLTTVPVIVKEFDDTQVMEVALIENLQRENLNPVEEAAAIRFLMEQHDLTQEEVATRLSKSRPAIANTLRLLNLPESVLAYVKDGRIQSGHARALVALPSEDMQLSLAKAIVEGGLSVRETEARAKAYNELKAPEKPAQKKLKTVDNDIAAAEEELRNALGTKVTIAGSAKRGKIVIEYFSREDLDRVYETITK